MIEHWDYETDLRSIVKYVHSFHRKYVEFDDAMQAAYVWFYSEAGQLYVAAHADDARKVAGRAGYAARRFCTREKVVLGVADTSDVLLYGTGVIRKLLPYAIHGMPSGSGGLSDAPKAKKDPAFAGDVQVMVWDMQQALKVLPSTDREFLELCVDHDNDWPAVGELMGVAAGVARGRFEKLIFAMRKELQEERDSQEFVGSRQVMSNAAGIAAVRDD